MIVVMPNANQLRVAAPDYVRAPGLPPGVPRSQRMTGGAKSIVGDLVPFIDEVCRTKADREHRATAGLSVGGAQAFYAAFNNLDTFAWVAELSGGFPVLPDVAVEYTLGEMPDYIHEWPVWRVHLLDLLPRLFRPDAS